MSPNLAVEIYQTGLRNAIEASGMQLTVDRDFAAWPRLSEEAGRGLLTPMLDPAWVTAEEGQFFSISGRDADGRLSHVQAARLVPLQGACLAENLIGARDLYCSLGLDLDPWLSRVRTATAWRLRGTAVYQGEVWIHKNWRGANLAPLLIMFLMMEVMRTWWPDFVYGLLLPVTANDAFVQKMGYQGFEPEAFAWHKADGTLLRNEGLVWAERVHLLSHANLAYALPEEIYFDGLGNPGEERQRVAVG